jgi:hypothetical protein
MNGDGGVAVVSIVAGHLDAEEPFAHVAVDGDKLIMALEAEALGLAISDLCSREFLCQCWLGGRR